MHGSVESISLRSSGGTVNNHGGSSATNVTHRVTRSVKVMPGYRRLVAPFALLLCTMLLIGNIAFIARQQSALHIRPLAQNEQHLVYRGGVNVISLPSETGDMNRHAETLQSTRHLRWHVASDKARSNNVAHEEQVLRDDVRDITDALRQQVIALNGVVARLKFDVSASLKEHRADELSKIQQQVPAAEISTMRTQISNGPGDTNGTKISVLESAANKIGGSVSAMEENVEGDSQSEDDNDDDDSSSPAEAYFTSIRNENATKLDLRMYDDFMWQREIDSGPDDDDDVDNDEDDDRPPFVIINNPVYETGDKPACHLQPDGPRPVILMTRGRSGSASTWQVLGNLTGEETHSVETTGSDSIESKKFFRNVTNTTTNGNWALKILCQKQKRHKEAGIVGFKWKPFASTFFTQGSTDALQMISHSYNPTIKVVRSRRNILDVIISGYKHQTAAGSDEKPKAHCKKGDEDCIQRHIQSGTGLVLPINDLYNKLVELDLEEDVIDRELEERGVPHIKVSFEKLYYSTDADEWQRTLRFLGFDSLAQNLTRAEVQVAMNHVATNHPHHNVTLANYEEVRSLLSGTQYEHLLH